MPRPNVEANPMSTGHIQTPRDELKAAVVTALEKAMVEFPRTVTEVAFRAIEAHAGGIFLVPRHGTRAMIDAARQEFGIVLYEINAANAASPYAPKVKP